MLQFDNAVEFFNKTILNEFKGLDVWVAGGIVRDYFMGVPLRTDYDLFFPDEKTFNSVKTFFIDNNAMIKWESVNGMKVVYKGKTFDLIKHYFSTPEATIAAFDFTVSMFAVDCKKVYVGESTFIDLAKRQLMLNNIPYPASTLSRAFRYYKKGFSMCAGEMKKLVEAIQGMPSASPVPPEDNAQASSADAGNFFIGID
jgi:hypothetical protein